MYTHNQMWMSTWSIGKKHRNLAQQLHVENKNNKKRGRGGGVWQQIGVNNLIEQNYDNKKKDIRKWFKVYESNE